jgi:hypothetical protein
VYNLIAILIFKTKIMTRTKGRVVLSKNPKENLDLAKIVYDKHLALGAASPLKLLQDVDWAITGPKIAPALTEHSAAEFHKGEMEKNYAARDLRMPDITKGLKQSITLLKATFGENPKKLSDWGISVDDTPVSKPKK